MNTGFHPGHHLFERKGFHPGAGYTKPKTQKKTMSKKASAKSKTRKRKRNKTPPFMRPTRLQYLDGSPEHKKKKLFSLNPSKNRTPSERGTFIFISHGYTDSSYENGVLTYKDTSIQADFLPLNSISFFVAKGDVLKMVTRTQTFELPRKICDGYFENVDVTTPKDNKWTLPMTVLNDKLSEKQTQHPYGSVGGLWICDKNGTVGRICRLSDMLVFNEPALQNKYNRKFPMITIRTLFRYLNEFCHENKIHPTNYDLRLFCCRGNAHSNIREKQSYLRTIIYDPPVYNPDEKAYLKKEKEYLKNIYKDNLIRVKVLGKETKNQKKFNKTLKKLKANFVNKMDDEVTGYDGITGGDKTFSLENMFEPVSKEEFKYKLLGPLPTKKFPKRKIPKQKKQNNQNHYHIVIQNQNTDVKGCFNFVFYIFYSWSSSLLLYIMYRFGSFGCSEGE